MRTLLLSVNDNRSHRHKDSHDDYSYRDTYEYLIIEKITASFLELEPWPPLLLRFWLRRGFRFQPLRGVLHWGRLNRIRIHYHPRHSRLYLGQQSHQGPCHHHPLAQNRCTRSQNQHLTLPHHSRLNRNHPRPAQQARSELAGGQNVRNACVVQARLWPPRASIVGLLPMGLTSMVNMGFESFK